MPSNTGAVDLGALSAEDKEQLAALAEERGGESEQEGPRQVLTAFMVIVGLDGNPEPAMFQDPSLAVMVPPTADLIYGACSTLLKDLAADETSRASAAMVMQGMMQQAQALAQQQDAARVAQSLDLSRLRG